MPCKPPRWVNIKDAAKIADCDKETVRRWCVDGLVHARKLAGGAWRIRIDDEGLPADPPEVWVSMEEAASRARVDTDVMKRLCELRRVHARQVGGLVWCVRLDSDGLPADPPTAEEHAQ